MTNDDMKCYFAEELEALRAKEGSRSDWERVRSTGADDLERLIAEDEAERGFEPDWTRAHLVLPEAKKSVHLRLERDVIEFFKSQGKGHIRRMQAVLRACAEAHRDKGGS